jgi:hypothetical protein
MRKSQDTHGADRNRNQGLLRICIPAGVLLIMTLAFTFPAAAVEPLPSGAWARLLSAYVSKGRVNYREIVKDPRLLEQSLEDFAKISRQDYGKWSRRDQIAFWINAYNLFTIKAVVDHYPPKGWNLLYPKISIRQIGAVWEKTAYRTAGQLVSLSQIEHEILRGVFREPRIHFALVCASLGCPPLLSVPYDGDSLEQMLDQQVRAYLADPIHGLYWNKEKRTLYLSKIFSWFGKDFGYYYTLHKLFPQLPLEKRNSLNFIWDYLSEPVKQSLAEKEFRISFLDYDWSLNDQPTN